MSGETFDLPTPPTAEREVIVDLEGNLLTGEQIAPEEPEVSHSTEQEGDDEDDEGHSAEAGGAEGEDPATLRKREERRAERRRRAQARRAREEGTQQLVQQLKEQNEHMATQLAAIQRSNVTTQIAQVDARVSGLQSREEQLLQIHANAVSVADGGTASAAMNELAQVRADKQTLLQARQNALRAMQQQPKPAASSSVADPGLPPAAIQRAREFMAKHDWYDPNGGDERSNIVVALDVAVTKDGYDPTTKAYWDELETRVNKYLPRAGSDSNNTRKDSASRVPVVGSARSMQTREGKVAFRLSAERVQAMKDAGMWEDSEKRKKMITRYQQADQKGGAA